MLGWLEEQESKIYSKQNVYLGKMFHWILLSFGRNDYSFLRKKDWWFLFVFVVVSQSHWQFLILRVLLLLLESQINNTNRKRCKHIRQKTYNKSANSDCFSISFCGSLAWKHFPIVSYSHSNICLVEYSSDSRVPPWYCFQQKQPYKQTLHTRVDILQ